MSIPCPVPEPFSYRSWYVSLAGLREQELSPLQADWLLGKIGELRTALNADPAVSLRATSDPHEQVLLLTLIAPMHTPEG